LSIGREASLASGAIASAGWLPEPVVERSTLDGLVRWRQFTRALPGPTDDSVSCSTSSGRNETPAGFGPRPMALKPDLRFRPESLLLPPA
jgi:hypothetical protein